MWAECWQCSDSDLFISAVCVTMGAWAPLPLCNEVISKQNENSSISSIFHHRTEVNRGSYCTHARVMTHRFSHTAGQRLHLFKDRGRRNIGIWLSPLYMVMIIWLYLNLTLYVDFLADISFNYNLLFKSMNVASSVISFLGIFLQL